MKHCPLCSTPLNRTLLEANLPAFSCSNCHGLWVSANEYLTWLAPNFSYPLPEIDLAHEFDTPYPVADNNKAILCPDCGRFLRRFQIWPNRKFHLDRCSSCNGIWFDRNEWQTLQAQNLHKQINIFFTEAWQEKLRGKEMQQRFENMYVELFGQEDYEKIKSIRHWLAEHPNGNRLTAYLTDRDPYKG